MAYDRDGAELSSGCPKSEKSMYTLGYYTLFSTFVEAL